MTYHTTKRFHVILLDRRRKPQRFLVEVQNHRLQRIIHKEHHENHNNAQANFEAYRQQVIKADTICSYCDDTGSVIRNGDQEYDCPMCNDS